MKGIENVEGDAKREGRKYDRLGVDERVGVVVSRRHFRHLTDYTHSDECVGVGVIE